MLPAKFGSIWPSSFQIKPNLVGSIYVRYSIKLLHLVTFGQQTWSPRAILFSDWLLLKKSSPPFGQAVSEEKIFFNSSHSETRIALGSHICWPNRTK
jgi:hypothetical protein